MAFKRKGCVRSATALRHWVKAARAHGYLMAGGKGRLPKKGSAGYKKIKATYHKTCKRTVRHD